MAYSMTGYGRGEATYATRRYLIEIKSVNNRFCDVQIRIPRGFIARENKIREKWDFSGTPINIFIRQK